MAIHNTTLNHVATYLEGYLGIKFILKEDIHFKVDISKMTIRGEDPDITALIYHDTDGECIVCKGLFGKILYVVPYSYFIGEAEAYQSLRPNMPLKKNLVFFTDQSHGLSVVSRGGLGLYKVKEFVTHYHPDITPPPPKPIRALLNRHFIYNHKGSISSPIEST